MSKTAKIYQFDSLDYGKILLTIKPHAVNLFTQPDNDLWTFDLEGRPIGMFIDGVNYRRTLSNHYFQKDRICIDGEDYRNVNPIGLGIAEGLIVNAHKLLSDIRPKLPLEIHPMIDRILSQNMPVLEKNGQAFNDIYLPISILPPDQYMAMVIQITEGCNYNRCTFCNFYRDRPFKIKTADEIEVHIDRVLDFLGEGIKLRKSIFLADANALVMPQNRLMGALEIIQKKIGSTREIFSFIDVFTGIRKSAADFSNLAALGLKRVYLGIESGDPELLELLHKPQVTDDIIDLAENLKRGGVQLGVIFLTGAGGWDYHAQHMNNSQALLEKLPLGKGDIIYLSEFYETNPEYETVLKKQGILQPNRQDIRKMTLDFKSQIQEITSKGVIISTYDIQQFLY